MFKQRLVLVGGGHTHALVLKHAAKNPLPACDLVLISETASSAYSGMLPGFVQGRYHKDEISIDLRRLAREAGASLVEAKAIGLDLEQRLVKLQDRPPFSYDYCSLNLGITPHMVQGDSAVAVGIPVKPATRFIEEWSALVQKAEELRGQHLVIVGAGAGGVELALNICRGPIDFAQVTLVQRAPSIMQGHALRARRLALKALAKAAPKLVLLTGSEITKVTTKSLVLASGKTISFDQLIWATNGMAAPWLRDTGLVLDEHGFPLVDAMLRCQGQQRVFAAGDIASLSQGPRPKAGVFAVRQGLPLYHNLRAAMLGHDLSKLRLQKNYLVLLNTGDGRAIANRGAVSFEGRWAFRLKEAIDKKFMRMFHDAGMRTLGASATLGTSGRASAAMDSPGATAAMACYGCGAKLPGLDLRLALDELQKSFPEVLARADITWGLPAREDVSQISLTGSHRLLQSLDFFPSLVDDPYLAGQLVVVHAFSDIIVKGGTPHSCHLLVILKDSASHHLRHDLAALLRGVASKLREVGACLLGGHTLKGEQLQVGVVAAGLSPSRPLGKRELMDGDALILTKPLGSGLIFAGDRQGMTAADHVHLALQPMLMSQVQLLEVLRLPAVHAATDVTGFGLLGHLQEMLEDFAGHAVLDPEAIPLLAGVRHLAERGVESSLYADNLALVQPALASGKIRGFDPSPALTRILADPQTCGGFLLSVDAASAADIINKINKLGLESAAIIGRLQSP